MNNDKLFGIDVSVDVDMNEKLPDTEITHQKFRGKIPVKQQEDIRENDLVPHAQKAEDQLARNDVQITSAEHSMEKEI